MISFMIRRTKRIENNFILECQKVFKSNSNQIIQSCEELRESVINTYQQNVDLSDISCQVMLISGKTFYWLCPKPIRDSKIDCLCNIFSPIWNLNGIPSTIKNGRFSDNSSLDKELKSVLFTELQNKRKLKL